jgi:hypothetical protein
MYIDIEPNDNLENAAMATFSASGPGRVINAVKLQLDDGWQWCAVTGWNEGPAPAHFTPIEESGDGQARLLTGDAHGLRLVRINQPQDAVHVTWSLTDGKQWAEPFLICLPETEINTP